MNTTSRPSVSVTSTEGHAAIAECAVRPLKRGVNAHRHACQATLLALLAFPLYAQLGPPPSSGASSSAAQLPLSGRNTTAGSVGTAQSSVTGATASVNTLNATVQIQGPLSGSVPGGAPLTGKLSLKEAVDRALAHNLGPIGLSQALRQARGQERVSRSALRPNLNGAFRENYFTQDLQALGIRIPGFPAVIGPITYFDLRATLTQNLVDLTAINNHRATEELVKANEQTLKDARESVVLAAGASWLQVYTARARIVSARQQLETAKALYDQTLQRRQAGIAAQIEVNRALVQQQIQQQRIATLENDLTRQKINLARITGLGANDNFDVTDSLPFAEPPALNLEDSVKLALDSRADLKAADAQIRAAERARTAAKSERLPSLAVSADVGAIGPRFSQTDHTYTVTGSIRIPIWQGGKAGGDLEQAEASLDQRRAEAADLRGRIEGDVRNGFADLKAASSQLQLAANNQELAKETLRLAQEKFETGVTDSVEVTQAAEAVATADLDRITALFVHNLAKLNLARSLGQAEQRLNEFLPIPQ
ncbi:MAG TPA: TolC family protein [Bryobacteraceae bacterium]|nr:TolC family protein [Bryobacteraceae bacterium]